jgi:hypothetical protein
VAISSAAVLAFAAPAAAADLYGLTEDQRLVRFDPATPGVVKASYEITGVLPGEELEGLTSSGAVLYAMSDAQRFYALGQDGEVEQVMDQLGSPWSNWWPAPGRLGLATDAAAQLQVLTDAGRWWMWRPPAGPPRNFGEVAHADGAPSPDVTAATHVGGREMGIDAARDALVARDADTSEDPTTGPGSFTTVGLLGIAVAAPIALEGRFMAHGGKLYEVDRATGAASEVGSIGSGLAIRDLALVEPAQIQCQLPRGWPSAEVEEGATTTISIYRRGDLAHEVSVDWSLAGGDVSGAGAEDYVAGGGRLVFAPGERRKDVTVTAHDDADLDYETIALRLSNAAGAPACGGVTITIVDDDARFHGAPDAPVGEGVDVPLEASRPPQAGEPRRYEVRVVGGTAEAGSDFVAPRFVDVPARGATVPIVVRTLPDGLPEPEETAVLELVDAAGGRAAGAGRVTLRIAAETPQLLATPARDLAAPALRDLTAPALSLYGPRTVRLSRSFRLPLRCSEACAVTASLTLSRSVARRLRVPTRIAKGSAKLLGSKRHAVSLKIAGRTFRRLRRTRSLTVQVRVSASDAAGNRSSLSAKRRLRR